MSEEQTVTNKTQSSAALWISLGIVFVLFLSVMYSLATRSQPTPSSPSMMELGLMALPEPKAVSGIALEGPEGATAAIGDPQSSWVVAYFGYTHCPDVCPQTLAQVAKLDEALSQIAHPELDYWMVSVDARDNAENTHTYVTNFIPRAQGYVLSDTALLPSLAAQLGIMTGEVDSDTGFMNHTASLLVFSPEGDLIAYLREGMSAYDMARSLRSLFEHSV